MTDRLRGRDRDTHHETSLAEVIDLAGRRILTGLIIAGGAIGIGLYAQPGPPRYQIVATDDGIARVNTSSGYVITCERGTCYRTLRPGQDFERASKQAQAEEQREQQRRLAPPSQAPTAAPGAQPAQQTAQPAAETEREGR